MSKEINKKLKELENKSTTYAVYGYEKETNKVTLLQDFDGMFCIDKEMEMFAHATVDSLEYAIKEAAHLQSDCLLIYLFMKDYPNKGFQITPFVIGVKTEEYNKVLDKFIS